MTKVTEKNTKAQILGAYEAAMREVKALKEGKTTTAEVVKAKEVKAVKEAAKQIVELNILNDDMMNKYKSLIATIEMLESEVNELYGIKREADSLEVLINTHATLTTELEAEHESKRKELNTKFETIRAELNNQLTEAREQNSKETATLKESFKEEKAKLEKERAREKEEYLYKLNRERAIENDKWEDQKATRENALSKREEEVSERELEIDAKDKTIESLGLKIEELTQNLHEEIDHAYESGKAKAKKDAETAKVFSDRAHKTELERKDDRIMSLDSNNAELRKANEVLQTKLDEAYTRIQNMALEAAKNSGTRVIESSK